MYVVNITVSAGDRGIDFASYDTSGHYVNYFAGVLQGRASGSAAVPGRFHPEHAI